MKYMAQVLIELDDHFEKEREVLVKEVKKTLTDMLEYGIGDLTDKKVEFETSRDFNLNIIVRAWTK